MTHFFTSCIIRSRIDAPSRVCPIGDTFVGKIVNGLRGKQEGRRGRCRRNSRRHARGSSNSAFSPQLDSKRGNPGLVLTTG